MVGVGGVAADQRASDGAVSMSEPGRECVFGEVLLSGQRQKLLPCELLLSHAYALNLDGVPLLE